MIEKKSVEQQDYQTFRTVFHYCFFIIVLPVVAFFGAKSIVFDGILGLSHVQSNVYSAVVSVVVVHIVLGFYILKAFSSDPSPKPAKQD